MLPFFTSLILTQPGWAEPFKPPPVPMKVVADQLATVPGTAIQVLAVLDIPTGWHIYWQNPGDSGQATQITVESNQATATSAPKWTGPEETLVLDGGVINYAYTQQAGALVNLQTSDQVQNLVEVDIVVDYLICKHACVPGQSLGHLSLPISTQSHASPHGPTIHQWTARLPRPLPEDSRKIWQQNEFTLQIPGATQGHLFPSEDLELGLQTQNWVSQGADLHLTLNLTSLPKEPLTGSVLRIFHADGRLVDYDLPVTPPDSP